MAALASPVPQLTCDELLRLKLFLQAYLDRFGPQFSRRDQAVSFAAYAKGLLSGERCKLGGNMNQVLRLQYFAADSSWSDQPFLEWHRQAVGAELGTREGVFLVGVVRQYCGRLGQVANCQAGVFVAYAGEGGATRVHRRLFLAEAGAYAER